MEVASRRLAVVQSHLTQSGLHQRYSRRDDGDEQEEGGVRIGRGVLVPSPTFATSISTDSSIVRHGGDLVAEALVREGVKFLFTLVGGHVSPVLTSARERGIRVIDVRHEVNTVFAADAVARVAGGVGVACVTAGPGLTNTITSLKNAQMANTPLILLGGATATLLKGRGALQDIDQQALLAPHVRWQKAIRSTSEILPAFERAFRIAQGIESVCDSGASKGLPGPVFIELPLDVLYPEEMIRKEVLGKVASSESSNNKQSSGGITESIARWYIERHLNRVFDVKTGLKLAELPYVASSVTRIDPLIELLPVYVSQLNTSATMLSRSHRPLMIIGSQVASALRGGEYNSTVPSAVGRNVLAGIDQLGVPFYLSGASRGMTGASHRFHMKHYRAKALKDADLVIMLGVPFDFRLGYGRGVPAGTPVISVNVDKHELLLNRYPTLSILAHPADFIIQLSNMLPKTIPRPEWIDRLRKRDHERDSEIAQMAAVETEKIKRQGGNFISPIKLLLETDKVLPDNSIIVADGGDFVGTASYILKPRGPLSWLDPGPFGTLGVGAGFAMGAKLVRPDAEVWLIWGDGSTAFSVMEYDTFIRHNIPVIALIGNDACWSQIYRDQVETFNSDVACMLSYSDYEKVSTALGGKGLVIDREENIASTLREAQRIAREEKKPVIVNALLSRSDFRKGSISV